VKVMQVARCMDDCNDFVQKLKVNDVDVEFVIDTGADVTVVTEDTRRRLRLKCERPRRVVVDASGSEMNITGQANVCIKSKNAVSDARIVVARDAEVNLLGRPQIRDLHLLRQADVGCSCNCETHPPAGVSKIRSVKEVSGVPVVLRNVTETRQKFPEWLPQRHRMKVYTRQKIGGRTTWSKMTGW